MLLVACDQSRRHSAILVVDVWKHAIRGGAVRCVLHEQRLHDRGLGVSADTRHSVERLDPAGGLWQRASEYVALIQKALLCDLDVLPGENVFVAISQG